MYMMHFFPIMRKMRLGGSRVRITKEIVCTEMLTLVFDKQVREQNLQGKECLHVQCLYGAVQNTRTLKNSYLQAILVKHAVPLHSNS